MRFIPTLNERRRWVQDRLNDIPSFGWHPTEGGYFAFVPVAGRVDSEPLAMQILDRVHVVTIPGNLFGGAAQGFLRLFYGSADMAALEKAFDRLGSFFAAR